LARAAVWAGALAYFAAVLAWMGGRPGAGGSLFPAGSAHNTSDSGVSLARRYLAARTGQPGGPARVDVLGRPIGEMGPERNAVVLRVAPSDRRKDLLSPAERAWVEGGGRLVLAVAAGYGPLRVAPGGGPVTKVFPGWQGVRTLDPPAARVLAAGVPLDAHAVFAAGAGPAFARWPLGRGDVLLLAVPEAIQNGALARADHLRLLEALAPGRPLYFDEHAHGLDARPGLLDLMASWGLGPALVLLVATAIVLLWRERARLGPPHDGHRERRTEAVDLLDSLALLYDRALSPAQALRLYRRGLERTVAAQSGLQGEALARRMADLTGGADDSLPALNEAHRRTLHGTG
jgi:hypothetical protein